MGVRWVLGGYWLSCTVNSQVLCDLSFLSVNSPSSMPVFCRMVSFTILFLVPQMNFPVSAAPGAIDFSETTRLKDYFLHKHLSSSAHSPV